MLSDLAVQASGGTVTVRGLELTAAELADAADRISRLLPPGDRREILVLGGGLEEPATRALLSWATVAGAALLLEQEAVNVLGTAVWARPTVFAGTVDETTRLRRAAERYEQGRLRRLRRPGPPFGRLHSVLVTEPGPLPQEDADFWRRRGVTVRFLPQCGIAWYISP